LFTAGATIGGAVARDPRAKVIVVVRRAIVAQGPALAATLPIVVTVTVV